MNRHLLVVDDDARLRELLRLYLSENGFRVTLAADAAEARANMASFAFDLVVLDVMMPGESGLSLTRDLRSKPPDAACPGPAADRDGRSRGPHQRGLEHGADDYLRQTLRTARTGPAHPQYSRPARHSRRRPETAVPALAFFASISARSELFRGGEIVHLTAAEAGLMSSLAARAGEAVSREDLSQSAQFGGNMRNVDVQMMRLRRKIEHDPRYPRYLHTVRGTGYALKPE